MDAPHGADAERCPVPERHHRQRRPGALLAFAYCLGLGIPFALAAMGLGWVSAALTFVRRHIRVVNIAGASMLIVLGALMATGVWVQWIYRPQNLSGTFLTPI